MLAFLHSSIVIVHKKWPAPPCYGVLSTNVTSKPLVWEMNNVTFGLCSPMNKEHRNVKWRRKLVNSTTIISGIKERPNSLNKTKGRVT